MRLSKYSPVERLEVSTCGLLHPLSHTHLGTADHPLVLNIGGFTLNFRIKVQD
jgi:hypothetical protein